MRAGLRDETESFHPAGSNAESSGTAGPSEPVAARVKVLAAGEEFGGYKIVRRLGRGGMGVVYEADQIETGRRVALKVLARSLDNTEARKRFLREGRLAASINHPNSVYVFGTDEVEHIPIISMELVRGGTLAEQVAKHGPLPVARAVDAILQVIDGLEAAREKGVLHRDVKPANCFIEPDGTVKIGDFGLSISTGPRDDISQTELTFAGQVLGTPAFASPEQLRGDELDVRSDIYSVAVTLFYLLTGDTPFRGKNLVQLLATVLEQPAPRVDRLQPDIPKGLANVIARCLHKLPEQRFRDYESLQQELLPFSTTAPTPALLGLRTLANVLDRILLGVCTSTFTLLFFPGVVTAQRLQAMETNPFFVAALITYSFEILYYGLTESFWGASIGKALLQLRVVDNSGSSPSLGRSLARAAIFVIWPSMFSIAHGIANAGVSPQELSVAPTVIFSMLLGPMYFLLLLSLFSTARRSNGYAGLHDRIGKVMVVSRQRETGRKPWAVEDLPLPQLKSLPTIGPFSVLDTLTRNEGGELLLGYDTRLLRRVWVHRRSQNLQPVPEAIRNITRPGRLRWLANGTDGDAVWDAYEAPRGVALGDALREEPEWPSIRYRLKDLAEELNISRDEGTLPELVAFDRLWVGSDGRMKLLDIQAPAGGDRPRDLPELSTTNSPDESCTEFISRVAQFMIAPKRQSERKLPLLVPLSARYAIDQLPAMTSLDAIRRRLGELLQAGPSISRYRRFGLMFCCIAPSLSVAFSLAMTGFVINRSVSKASPELVELSHATALLQSYEQSSNSSETQELIRTWISGHHRKTIERAENWEAYGTLALHNPETRRILELLAAQPIPDADKLSTADAVVQPLIDERASANPGMATIYSSGPAAGFYSVGVIPGMMAAVWFEFIWFPSLFAAQFFRGGLLLRIFNMVAVRRDGRRASGLRMFWRALVPAPIGLLLAFLGMAQIAGGHFLSLLTPFVSWLALFLVGMLLIISAWHPQRSISDRLAGTYLVPR